jgi:SOS-response transcriptional repressor LexA
MENDTEAMAEGNGVSIHAGFPNPAAGKKGSSLSLDQLLIQHPSSSYLFRIEGNSHEAYGIFDGDLALIDRAIKPRADDLVIAWHDSGFTVSHLATLLPDIEPWGTVAAVIHQYRRTK